MLKFRDKTVMMLKEKAIVMSCRRQLTESLIALFVVMAL